MIRAARWIAIVIALTAIVDPRVPLPQSQRPVVRVVSPQRHDTTAVVDALKQAGFVVDPAARETATVLVGSEVGDRGPGTRDQGSGTGDQRSGIGPLFVLNTAAPAPNVSITRAAAPAIRLPAQAVDLTVELHASGVAGQTTELVLEQGGIPVATGTYKWTDSKGRWTSTLRYLPPTASGAPLRVRASAASGETTLEDNVFDVAVPPVRGPVRVLVVEAAVTWPAVFVRRALEGEPAVALSSLQRAAKSVVTRAGDPPASLTRSSLARFEAVVVGGPDELRPSDIDALRWFVEDRGGVAVFVPDRAPAGRYVDLLGIRGFTARTLEAPVRLAANLHASELVVPRDLPAAVTVLASADNAPVVISARRGAGAVVFSGALDAWRLRGDGFAEFWRAILVSHAAGVPPPIDVTAEPALARPGETTTVTVRLRDVVDGDVITFPPVTARVVSPDAGIDEPLRLWPTAEPGVYHGDWRGRVTGQYNVTVSAGDLRGDTSITIDAAVARGSRADPEALELAVGATGGRIFPAGDISSLIDAMTAALPRQRGMRESHPMRSAWWMVPFVGLLCAEWAVRRKRGLP